MSRFARLAFTCFSLVLMSVGAFALEPVTPSPLACSPGLFDSRREEDAAKNVSGIDCIKGSSPSSWSCVAVADEEIAITEFTLSRDKDGDLACAPGPSFAPERFGCLPGNLDSDRDFEGVTLSPEGLIAVTSLGLSRGRAKKTKWALFRDSPGKCDAMGRGALLAFIASAKAPELDWAVDRTLQCGGLNVEGLESLGDTLYFGLRSPSERAEGIAYVISAPNNVFFGPEHPKPGAATLHKIKFLGDNGLPVAGIGIRGIDTANGKLILLTGDAGVNGSEAAIARSNEPDKPGCRDLMSGLQHPNAETGLAPMIWSWEPGTLQARLITVLGGPYANAKAEGITVIQGENGKSDIVIAIDDPAEIATQLAVIKGVTLP